MNNSKENSGAHSKELSAQLDLLDDLLHNYLGLGSRHQKYEESNDKEQLSSEQSCLGFQAKYFLKKQAIKSKYKQTTRLTGSTYDSLFQAVVDEDTQVLMTWIRAKGNIRVVSEKSGRSLLHEAACIGNEKIVRILLSRNRYNSIARVNKKTLLGGETALHLASRNGHNHICRVLLRFGADVNIKNKFGYTPLHLAATKEIVHTLLDNGANVLLKSNKHMTALDTAQNKDVRDALAGVTVKAMVRRSQLRETRRHKALSKMK